MYTRLTLSKGLPIKSIPSPKPSDESLATVPPLVVNSLFSSKISHERAFSGNRRNLQEKMQSPSNQDDTALAFVLQPEVEVSELERVTRTVLGSFRKLRPRVFAAECNMGDELDKVITRNCAWFENLRKNKLRRGDRGIPRFNFLVEDHRRPGVATVFAMPQAALKSLYQGTHPKMPVFDYQASLNAEKATLSSTSRLCKIGDESDQLSELYHAVAPHVNQDLRVALLDERLYLSLLSHVMSLGIASYASSHCYDIILDPDSDPAEEFQINVDGRSALLYRKRRLSCLGSLIGDSAWILTSPTSNSDKFVVSTTVSDFADLWGPVWGIEAEGRPGVLSLFTERGELFPVDLSINDPIAYKEEVFCHWRRLTHGEHLNRKQEIQQLLNAEAPPKLFSLRSPLLIGMESTLQPDFSENLQCLREFEAALTKARSDKIISGSHDGRWKLDSRAMAISGGHFITIGATQTHRSVPASTQKDRIYAMIQSETKLPSIIPIMRLRVGLEISICTGNAERVSLWQALKVSCISSIQRWVENLLLMAKD